MRTSYVTRYLAIFLLCYTAFSCSKSRTDDEKRSTIKWLEINPHSGVNNVNLGQPKRDFGNDKLKFNEHPMKFYKETIRNHKLGTFYPSFDSVFLAGTYHESLIPSLFFRNDSLVMLEVFTFPHGTYDSVIFSLNKKDYSRFDIAKIKSDFQTEIECIKGDTTLGTVHDVYILKRENISLLVVEGQIRKINLY